MPLAGSTYHVGDLNDSQVLRDFLRGTDVVVNLAWPTCAEVAPESFARYLAEACIETKVSRLIQVSTAMVVGRPCASCVDESTVPNPLTAYEKNKLAVEQQLRASLDSQVDLAILRPTAVFGPGSKNLEQLARRMLDWPLWARHLQRFLYGKRNMHLVPVEHVVQAIEWLAQHPEPLRGEAFIIDADAHKANHYQAIDELLAPILGAPLVRSTVHLPSPLLHLLLRVLRRSQDDPNMHICGNRLRRLGFAPKKNFEQAVIEYGQWYAQHGVGRS